MGLRVFARVGVQTPSADVAHLPPTSAMPPQPSISAPSFAQSPRPKARARSQDLPSPHMFLQHMGIPSARRGRAQRGRPAMATHKFALRPYQVAAPQLRSLKPRPKRRIHLCTQDRARRPRPHVAPQQAANFASRSVTGTLTPQPLPQTHRRTKGPPTPRSALPADRPDNSREARIG